MCNFVQLFFKLWVGDAGVIDGLQLFDEHGLGIGDVAEGDGALLEVALSHLGVDETVYQFADALLRIVGQ